METKRLFGGLVEDASSLKKGSYNFQVGEVIYGLLGMAFNDSGNFVISSIEDRFLNLVEKGGRHRKTKVNKSFVEPISKRFGIGYYYKDKDMPEFLSPKEIETLIEEANAEEKRLQEEEERERIRQAELADSFKEKYSFLNWFIPGSWIKSTEVAKNVRLMLKHEFPGIKFSVRKDGYDTIQVTCPEKSMVKEVHDKIRCFKDHVTDVSGDFLDYSPSVFNRCFGGCRFLFVE